MFVVLGVYCFFMLWITVLNREPRNERVVVFDLLWPFKQWFSGGRRDSTEVVQFGENILLFIPLGVLFPWREGGVIRSTFFAVVFSVMIELISMFSYLAGVNLMM